MTAFIVLGALLAVLSCVLSGAWAVRVVGATGGLALLGAALVAKRSKVTITDAELYYQRGWSSQRCALADMHSLDVPTNYRLLYVELHSGSADGRLRLPLLSFEHVESLASRLLSEVPEEAISDRARRTLQGLADGERPDRIVRWRDDDIETG